jgi:hypothetical protein
MTRRPASLPTPNVALLAALLALGCRSPTGPRSDLLAVTARTAALRLTNRSAETVYFVAAERETFALIDLAYCEQPATCTGSQVPAGQSVDVPAAQIAGYRRGAQVLVMHWHLVPHPSEARYVADSVRTISVRVR